MGVHNSILVLLAVYLISLVNVSSAECVPVFMWGNVQYNELVSPLKKLNQESFNDVLQNQIDKKSLIVVFVEQTLSSEDFISEDENGKSIFATLDLLKESTTVNYFQCVKNPVTSITSLKERNVVQSSFEDVMNEPLKIQHGDVLLIAMNDANDDEDRIDMLHRHDRNMATIYARLVKDHKDIVMIYTAYGPSWIISEDVRSHRHIRDVSKPNDTEPEPSYLVIKNNDILISSMSNPLLVCNGTTVSLDTFTEITTENKSEEGMNITLKSPTVTHITLTFEFLFAGGYWIMDNITVLNTSAPEQDNKYYFRVKEFYAPELFSYHCSNMLFYFPRNPNQNLSFKELQIQPFLNETKVKFGYPYDCVGFMSAPIWSGLFVTFILVLIMTCGLTMMMDIKTMDRFDDPKGKTITVTATE
ncbi:hypothetical protein PPYR_05724 [Photinus pyralis]|uniref:Vacuolar H+ ATPase AC45 accessory subunit n=1 Tax=Photinus pyralis TaxID=7054 RepID=A0A1Y1NDP6_PHOPY|nr:V-type proton ATPase subunit S1 [Photinus pyralis]KAB0801370.1 hypothetical protein PPYR_05724 [Photinus pyralis]